MRTLDEILDDFACDGPEPSRDKLMDYVRLHPEHAREIASFYADWVWLGMIPADENRAEDEADRRIVERGMERVRESLRERLG